LRGKISSRSIAICGLIAAVYTALCLATPILSYSVVQVRVAEALTLLPVLSPIGIWGVTLGCAVSNLVGWLSGANPIGFLDTIFGTSATLIAAIITYRLRHVRYRGLPVLSALAPVVVNAVVIGAQLSILVTGGLSPLAMLINGASVAAGQLIACVILGLPLVMALEKKGIVPR